MHEGCPAGRSDLSSVHSNQIVAGRTGCPAAWSLIYTVDKPYKQLNHKQYLCRLVQWALLWTSSWTTTQHAASGQWAAWTARGRRLNKTSNASRIYAPSIPGLEAGACSHIGCRHGFNGHSRN
ncbi:hypothetical protein J6590_048980 [Homalodisca vitripennis]|nr:hypothetical protein J6590_048980 [Homalodisca vitripennis]